MITKSGEARIPTLLIGTGSPAVVVIVKPNPRMFTWVAYKITNVPASVTSETDNVTLMSTGSCGLRAAGRGMSGIGCGTGRSSGMSSPKLDSGDGAAEGIGTSSGAGIGKFDGGEGAGGDGGVSPAGCGPGLGIGIGTGAEDCGTGTG